MIRTSEPFTTASFDQIVEGIDRQLSYLHKERWGQQYAELMDAMHTTTGEARERTRQAMQGRGEASIPALLVNAQRSEPVAGFVDLSL